MKKFMKILFWFILVIILVVVAFVGYIQVGAKKTFDAPYPDIKASTDSAVIERGRYLVYGASHCVSCHVPMDKVMAVDNGLRIPLSGGWYEEIPGLGLFRGPNLTPDPETGIGMLTDAEIARTIRYGVKPDGTFLPPFMQFQGMSDEDLTAIISFLRSQKPVKHEVEPSELTMLAKALVAFGQLEPEGPESTPPKSVKRDTTAVYGKYLAESLGNCRGCHVKIDDKGQQVTPDFSGGMLFRPNPLSEGYAFVSPNITPHKTTGIMADWNEEAFVERFKGGRLFEGSPMPWGLFSRMDESDLKALYAYLQSIEPVENKIEQIVFMPGDKLPE